MSIQDAARRLGQSTQTIRRRIADGTLTAYRVGPRAIRLDTAEVEALAQPVPIVRRPA
jgi:excisionase family DNA binding protein